MIWGQKCAQLLEFGAIHLISNYMCWGCVLVSPGLNFGQLGYSWDRCVIVLTPKGVCIRSDCIRISLDVEGFPQLLLWKGQYLGVLAATIEKGMFCSVEILRISARWWWVGH